MSFSARQRRPATAAGCRRRWSREPVVVGGQIHYPLEDPRRQAKSRPATTDTMTSSAGSRSSNEAWRTCCYDRETGKLGTPVKGMVSHSEAQRTSARYVRCYYHDGSGATRWTRPLRCWYDARRDVTKWKRDECMSPTRAVPCWYESGKIIFDREVKAEPKLLRILFDSDDLNSARTHPELDKTVKRAWQVDDDSYFGALRRAPRVLDDVGRNPSSLTDYCHGLRAVLAPALDEDGVRVDDARKNDRASLLLALVRGLLPIAAPTPPRTATTIQPGISDHVAGGEDEGNLERTGRLALATSLGLVGRAAGPHSIRACANEMTARALLSVFDNIAAKALAVLVRSWRKQRLTHMPLKDLFEAALNALKIEPPSSKEIASYLALAVAVVGSALSSRKTTTTPREDDWLREIVGENGDSTRRRALLDETLNTILSDPAVERRAVAQATLLRDLIKPKG